MSLAVDTSALIAVVFGESDAASIAAVLAAHAGDIAVSATTLLEAQIVVEARQGPDAGDDLHRLIARVSAEVVPFDDAQYRLAAAAWRRFGKGRHPAGLNFGDCVSYALARQLGAPLLFKGDDFAQTDIARAL